MDTVPCAICRFPTMTERTDTVTICANCAMIAKNKAWPDGSRPEVTASERIRITRVYRELTS